MKFNTEELLADLTDRSKQALATISNYRSLDEASLNRKPHAGSWSKLECLEHLNLYGDFYLPEIERSILQAKRGFQPVFKSGVIGNYFAKLMQIKPDGTVKKMKSPADKNPAHSDLSVTTVERFLKQQEQLLRLLEMAQKVDLKQSKTPISISKMIKLRLGDTLRFYVYHIERHILQAEKIS
ncbi:MAG TPA: DinB family protein [Fluviicola sp.]|nr:DinB family protein [Fluviicola sp.]